MHKSVVQQLNRITAAWRFPVCFWLSFFYIHTSLQTNSPWQQEGRLKCVVMAAECSAGLPFSGRRARSDRFRSTCTCMYVVVFSVSVGLKLISLIPLQRCCRSADKGVSSDHRRCLFCFCSTLPCSCEDFLLSCLFMALGQWSLWPRSHSHEHDLPHKPPPGLKDGLIRFRWSEVTVWPQTPEFARTTKWF